MHASIKPLFAFAALSLAVVSTAARADTLTFIPADFNPALSSGNDNAAMISYSQDGFLIVPGDTSSSATTTTGQFDENFFQGNPAPGLASGTDIGDPVSSFTITDGGNPFSLLSFQVDPNQSTGSVGWKIYNGATLLGSGTDTTLGSYSTIVPTLSGPETSFTVQFTDTTSGSIYYVDNVNVTPEPSSLILCGSGLLGLAASIRRRIAV